MVVLLNSGALSNRSPWVTCSCLEVLRILLITSLRVVEETVRKITGAKIVEGDIW